MNAPQETINMQIDTTSAARTNHALQQLQHIAEHTYNSRAQIRPGEALSDALCTNTGRLAGKANSHKAFEIRAEMHGTKV
jgi:hypothetical protein